MQDYAIPCNNRQYQAIPCNTIQYHAIPLDFKLQHFLVRQFPGSDRSETQSFSTGWSNILPVIWPTMNKKINSGWLEIARWPQIMSLAPFILNIFSKYYLLKIIVFSLLSPSTPKQHKWSSGFSSGAAEVDVVFTAPLSYQVNVVVHWGIRSTLKLAIVHLGWEPQWFLCLVT